MTEEKNESEVMEQTNEKEEVQSMEEVAATTLEIPPLEVGQTVQGTVTKLEEKHVVVEVEECLNDNCNCIVPISELALTHIEKVSDAVSVGDNLTLVVTKLDQDTTILSKKKVDFEKVWAELEAKFNSGEIIETAVTEVVKGGLVVNIGLRGFVPASMVDDKFVEDLSPYQDQVLTFKIVEMEKEKARVILSHREVVRAEKQLAQAQAIAALEVGAIVPGTVVRLASFGAFVNIGAVEGLVHVSQISHEHLKNPADALSEGQEVQVKILKVDPDNKKVSLSIKETMPTPWEQHLADVSAGAVFEGKVRRLTDFGAFVEVFPGIEGLVHISEISHQHIKTPHEVIREGEAVKVKVLKLDADAQKLSLSIKQLLENPEAEITDYDLPKESTGFSIGELFADKFKGLQLATKEEAPKKAKKETTVETKEVKKEVQAEASEDIVFYTPTGKTYHVKAECSRLSKSKNVLSGTLAEANESGHDTPCSLCVK